MTSIDLRPPTHQLNITGNAGTTVSHTCVSMCGRVLLFFLLCRQSPEPGVWWISYQRKEGNVLFNDALNTFYLRLYVVRCKVENHLDSERTTWTTRGNKGSFKCTIPRQGSTYHGFWYTCCGSLAGNRNNSMGSP